MHAAGTHGLVPSTSLSNGRMGTASGTRLRRSALLRCPVLLHTPSLCNAPRRAVCLPCLQEDEEEERAQRSTREISFEAAKRIRAELAHPAVLHFYAWLLQGGCKRRPVSRNSPAELACWADGARQAGCGPACDAQTWLRPSRQWCPAVL